MDGVMSAAGMKKKMTISLKNVRYSQDKAKHSIPSDRPLESF